MSDKLTETTVPESQLPHLQKEEMARGKDDLEFCIEAINKDYPVQYSDYVGFYDRLLENGLKITAGELAATKEFGEYSQGVDKLWALAVAAHTFNPNGNKGQLSDQELTAHKQAIGVLENILTQPETWLGQQKVNPEKLNKFFASVEEKVLTKPISYTRKG